MATIAPPPTLAELLSRRDLRLRPVTRISREQREAPLRWVHSSDLADPARFLDEGVILLTTGAQLADTDADAYVERIVARDVAALGFGTGVVLPEVPGDLVRACERSGLALFEVPYRTPFLAVVRAAADAIAAHGSARRSWALAAQRAVALAALRADPLAAALGELAHQLGAWVGLFDPAGDLTIARPSHLDPDAAAAVRRAAVAMLERGTRAADTVMAAGRTLTVQTLGRGGELRGALVVETARLDQEARGVVTTVVAMAGFALERAAGLTRGHAALRAGVLRALLRGDDELAHDVAAAAWGSLPDEPIRVSAVTAASDDVLGYLESRTEHAPGEIFFAPVGERGLVIVTASDTDPLSALWERFSVPTGLSRPTAYARLGSAIDEAHAAVPREGVAEYIPRAVDLFRTPGDDLVTAARALVAPLRNHDAKEGTTLEHDLRVWLANDGAHDPAARALGVHRHTVRARVAQASGILDLDLATFDGRATLWAALRATEA